MPDQTIHPTEQTTENLNNDGKVIYLEEIKDSVPPGFHNAAGFDEREARDNVNLSVIDAFNKAIKKTLSPSQDENYTNSVIERLHKVDNALSALPNPPDNNAIESTLYTALNSIASDSLAQDATLAGKILDLSREYQGKHSLTFSKDTPPFNQLDLPDKDFMSLKSAIEELGSGASAYTKDSLASAIEANSDPISLHQAVSIVDNELNNLDGVQANIGFKKASNRSIFANKMIGLYPNEKFEINQISDYSNSNNMAQGHPYPSTDFDDSTPPDFHNMAGFDDNQFANLEDNIPPDIQDMAGFNEQAPQTLEEKANHLATLQSIVDSKQDDLKNIGINDVQQINHNIQGFSDELSKLDISPEHHQAFLHNHLEKILTDHSKTHGSDMGIADRAEISHNTKVLVRDIGIEDYAANSNGLSELKDFGLSLSDKMILKNSLDELPLYAQQIVIGDLNENIGNDNNKTATMNIILSRTGRSLSHFDNQHQRIVLNPPSLTNQFSDTVAKQTKAFYGNQALPASSISQIIGKHAPKNSAMKVSKPKPYPKHQNSDSYKQKNNDYQHTTPQQPSYSNHVHKSIFGSQFVGTKQDAPAAIKDSSPVSNTTNTANSVINPMKKATESIELPDSFNQDFFNGIQRGYQDLQGRYADSNACQQTLLKDTNGFFDDIASYLDNNKSIDNGYDKSQLQNIGSSMDAIKSFCKDIDEKARNKGFHEGSNPFVQDYKKKHGKEPAIQEKAKESLDALENIKQSIDALLENISKAVKRIYASARGGAASSTMV